MSRYGRSDTLCSSKCNSARHLKTSFCSPFFFITRFDSGPQSYANFQWLQSIRVFADGSAAGLVHNEFKGEFAPLGTYCSKECADRSPVNATGCRDEICELWSTGLAISTNGGSTFSLIARPPGHLVAALPHRYTFDENITGYGAVSSMIRGKDGAFYGLINVQNQCPHGSGSCGHIPAGNCIWRAANLKDPTSFRARDRDGNFTVQWASAYEPGGLDKGECATLPVTPDGPFGSHVTFRKVVPPRRRDGDGRVPTYIALSDVYPDKGRVKYSMTYEADFGWAVRNINASWSKPQFLDLDGLDYRYPTLLDARSPELGETISGLAAQEDGDSYALVSYPQQDAPPRPGPVVSVRVVGAGDQACNGLYLKKAVPEGFNSVSDLFRLDEYHSIYRQADEWHIAHLGVEVWYSTRDSTRVRGSPPSTGWKEVQGRSPPPSSVSGISGPNSTSTTSLYLYLRVEGRFIRRKLEIKD